MPTVTDVNIVCHRQNVGYILSMSIAHPADPDLSVRSNLSVTAEAMRDQLNWSVLEHRLLSLCAKRAAADLDWDLERVRLRINRSGYPIPLKPTRQAAYAAQGQG